MKTLDMMRVMMAVVMMAASMNMTAQGRRGGNFDAPQRGTGREMVMNSRGGFEMHGDRHDGRMEIEHRPAVRHAAPAVGMHHHAAPVAVVHHYDRGPWAGRVRHMDDGRWGYYRDNRWYYYDCYYEPDFYFAHPLHHFHGHCLGTVAAAAVTTAAVATLISALVH